MVHKIVWIVRALSSYEKNIAYLVREWSEKEVLRLKHTTEKKLDAIAVHPFIGASQGKKDLNIRTLVLHKRIKLVYRIVPKKNAIELLFFWNTYQDPIKLH